MAKGSVRKKGKKWYYRYYVEDASGNRIQKECVGTESKAETEKLLREAIKDLTVGPEPDHSLKSVLDRIFGA